MKTKPQPFTLKHFRSWASTLILDSFEPWVLEPFQEAFLEDVFSGTSACWLVVPEGNGKTTLVAGLVLYHIQHTEEASVPVAASSARQAMILYRQAEGFCLRSPHLAVTGHFKCQDGYKKIKFTPLRSELQVFAADDATADGQIPTMAVVEELHRHKNLALYDTWRGKYGKRKGQTIVISTAGEPGGEFELRREQVRQKSQTPTREGAFIRAASDELVLHEWALQEGADPEDLEAVKRANPFSGITLETLRHKFEAPDFSLNHWRRFTCNLPTRSDLAAIQEKEWFDAKTDEEIPAGEEVWVGLDLGFKVDTTAVVPLWIRDEEFRLLGPARILVPPRDNTFMDHARIKDALSEVHERNPVRVIVMDMHEGREIALWAEEELGAEIVARGQQIPQKVEDYQLFTEALRMGWLRHPGDEVFTSHVLNAVTRLLPGGDSCFARPIKWSGSGDKQDRRVIDALVAAAMVHAVAVGNPVSVYEDRELIAV